MSQQEKNAHELSKPQQIEKKKEKQKRPVYITVWSLKEAVLRGRFALYIKVDQMHFASNMFCVTEDRFFVFKTNNNKCNKHVHAKRYYQTPQLFEKKTQDIPELQSSKYQQYNMR